MIIQGGLRSRAGKQRFTAVDKVGEKLNKQVLLDFQHFARIKLFPRTAFCCIGELIHLRMFSANAME